MTERVSFRGGLTCSCVVASLPYVEFELKMRGYLKPLEQVHVFQWGYRGDVSASAGTHNRGGCVDVNYPRDVGETDVWRLWGWTQQARRLTGTPLHSHGWPYRCPHLSTAAKQQESDWNRKDAGLQGSGQVTGRWPVKPWSIALRERKMSIAGEIADAVAAELSGNRKFLDAVADSVLNRDGQIPNTFTGNPANKFVALATAVGVLGERSKSS